MTLSLEVIAWAALSLMLLALVSAVVTLKVKNRKLSEVQEWIDQFDGRITFNADGLLLSKPSHVSSIAWSDLVKVELFWAENPFEDPQFGRYCDTEWLLWSCNGSFLNISESVNDSNSKTLLHAFAKFLPAFDFDYAQFNETHGNRIHDLKGGRVVVWQRDA